MKKAILIFGCGLLSNLVFGQITNANLVEIEKSRIKR